MKKERAIEILNQIRRQFETSLEEAEVGDEYALESQEENAEAIEALDLAIRQLSK